MRRPLLALILTMALTSWLYPGPWTRWNPLPAPLHCPDPASLRSESDLQTDLRVPAWLPLNDAEQLLCSASVTGLFADATSSFDSTAQVRMIPSNRN